MRLQCSICGGKSGAVASLPPSAREAAMLAEFRLQHNTVCVNGERLVYPGGAVEREPERPVPQGGPFGSPRPPPLAARRAHGHFERTGPYGEQEEGDTLSCCHCSRHWEVRVGSGRTRGFCSRCCGYTCGAAACDVCVPVEARRKNVEAGRPVLTPTPPQILVPDLSDVEDYGGPVETA